jgi:NADPH-dependent 2,4-dienoyl-CoA reductase/sulfur reductase-like enzyme/nitrite reductase/ring-hydroxylating ferredoxin subunit
MSADSKTPSGPDLAAGIAFDDIADGAMIQGRVGDDPVLLARRGDELFAVGAQCTHYHGPLAEGLMVGDTVRCPWHHACFSLRTGEAVRVPAFDPLPRWRIQRQGDKVFVRDKQPPSGPKPAPADTAKRAWPASVVIVGGGAAGFAAAEMLRREGYDRPVTLLSADEAPPCDRPNLSKDYLAGTAQESWIPLKSPKFYEKRAIELRLGTRVTAIDPRNRRVTLADGKALDYGALLLATGAEPVRLDLPAADPAAVHYLRTLADSKAIIAAAATAKRALVIGASFIGLEVAASLRARKLDVHVVGPEARPLERVMGPELGDAVRRLHEKNGVVFHLGETVTKLEGRTARLSGGASLAADLIVIGVGVRPATALAEAAGLATDKGITVDEYLQTSAPGIYAAGDIARWPDPHSGERIRVEHWVVAERQGQTAARNILGARQRHDFVPFFWSQHYDMSINYVGHATRWDSTKVEGSLADNDAQVTFLQSGKPLAVATIFRDRASLAAEAEMEKRTAPK